MDSESEAALFVGEGAPGEGRGLAGGDDVLPDDGSTGERVEEAVVGGEAEGEGGGVEVAGEVDMGGGGDGGGVGEVELDGVVELVGVDAVDFGDVEVAVGGERVADAGEELGEEAADFWGYD